MNWNEYVKEAVVTASRTRGRDVELMVCGLGLCGETSEMATCGRDEIVGELGDVCWYAAAIWHWCGLEGSLPLTAAICPMEIGSGMVAEMIKKHVVYGRPLDKDKLKFKLSSILADVEEIAELESMTFSKVLELNIEKLRKRFGGGGFDTSLAEKKLEMAT